MRSLVLLAALTAAGCHPADIDPLDRQPKLKPYAASDLSPDGRAMRAPPAGAVPRERELAGAPPPVTPALLALGRARFDVVCAPCHGLAGDGDSIVAGKMALRPPPSLHEARIRALGDDAIDNWPAARSFEDYAITVERDALPEGIELIEH